MVKMTEEDPDYEGKWPEGDAMTEWVMVPREPVDAQFGELARDIVMWWTFSPPTGDALHRHLKRLGRDIPAWLPDLIADRMYVPPKGAVAAAIYRAMLDAAPAAPQQAEPVAWMFDRRYGSGLSFVRPADYENEDGDMVSPTPLYRHPPADEVQGLRDAAQDVCEWARASQWAAGEDALVPASRLDALLAALEGK